MTPKTPGRLACEAFWTAVVDETDPDGAWAWAQERGVTGAWEAAARAAAIAKVGETLDVAIVQPGDTLAVAFHQPISYATAKAIRDEWNRLATSAQLLILDDVSGFGTDHRARIAGLEKTVASLVAQNDELKDELALARDRLEHLAEETGRPGTPDAVRSARAVLRIARAIEDVTP